MCTGGRDSLAAALATIFVSVVSLNASETRCVHSAMPASRSASMSCWPSLRIAGKLRAPRDPQMAQRRVHGPGVQLPQ